MTEIKANTLAFVAIVACVGIQSWRQINNAGKRGCDVKNIVNASLQKNVKSGFDSVVNNTCNQTVDDLNNTNYWWH